MKELTIAEIEEILDQKKIRAKAILKEIDAKYTVLNKLESDDSEKANAKYDEVSEEIERLDLEFEEIFSPIILVGLFDKSIERAECELYNPSKIKISKELSDTLIKFDKDILRLREVYSENAIEKRVSMLHLNYQFGVDDKISQKYLVKFEDDFKIKGKQ